MSDYAAAPSQVVLQGLIYIDSFGDPQFYGRGVAGIFRGAFPGTFILELDPDLPGSVGIDPAMARSLLMVRGQQTGGLPVTTIDQKAITYPSSPPGAPPAIFVRVALTADGAGVDPSGVNGNGCEIVVWRGDAGAGGASVQIVGGLGTILGA